MFKKYLLIVALSLLPVLGFGKSHLVPLCTVAVGDKGLHFISGIRPDYTIMCTPRFVDALIKFLNK